MWEDGEQQPVKQEPSKAEPTSGEPGKGKDTKQQDNKEFVSRKDYERQQQRIEELEQSERFWASKATTRDEEAPRGKGKGKKEEPEEEDDGLAALLAEEPEKFTDELSAKGIRSLVERGFITERRASKLIRDIAKGVIAQEVEPMIASQIKKAQAGMAADAELVDKYSDLKNPKSAMYIRTAEVLKELTAKGIPKENALEVAARIAHGETKTDRSDRQERISRQGGSDETRTGGYSGEEDDNTVSPMQREMLKRLNAEGGIQISEEAYAARAKKGVNMFRGPSAGASKYRPGSMNWAGGDE